MRSRETRPPEDALTARRPPLEGLRHVALYVTDVDRSLAFYRDVMGMTLEWRPDADNAYLTSGTDNLALHRRTEPAGEGQTLDHIGFLVPQPDDVDAWGRHLEAAGVRILQPPKTHRDGARSLYLADPDDIAIQVIFHPPISGKRPSG